MQGRFQMRECLLQTTGEDLQTEQTKEAVKLLSTLLNNFGCGDCRYENYPNKTLSTPGGKTE